MFKTFGTTKEVFVNQDEGMFVAMPITLDENVLTLETEQEGGRTYAKAGSVVKEGSVVRGILAERYDITDGAVPARVVMEGYCWASALTKAALDAAANLPKIVIMPYKTVVVNVGAIDELKAIIHIEGAKFADTAAKENFTVTGGTISAVSVKENGDIELTFAAAGNISITAIASAAFTGATGATLKGLPVNFTVGGNN